MSAAQTAGSAEPRPTGWSARDEFLVRQVQASRTIELTAGTAALLRWLRERGLPLGIVSNAQAYTWRELELALAVHGLDLSLFERELCFLSFEHGFSKPDPHVFRILTARLEARGIRPAEILMVGDRLDNDIAPAQAHGWRVWHLTADDPGPGPGGSWRKLRGRLQDPAASNPGWRVPSSSSHFGPGTG